MTKNNPSFYVVSIALSLLASSAALAQNAPPPPAPGPGITLALEAAQTAVATCTANGYNVSVTVLDSGGVTRLIYANDKAADGPIESATRKAYTALQFKQPTADVATKAAADSALAAKINADPKLFARADDFR
jgi:uncharacterized protein GlcG (DUF336 family)